MNKFRAHSSDRSPVKSIKHYSVEIQLAEYVTDNDGRMLLTPDMVSPSEIDYHIDQLIADLNKVRLSAKKILAKNDGIQTKASK